MNNIRDSKKTLITGIPGKGKNIKMLNKEYIRSISENFTKTVIIMDPAVKVDKVYVIKNEADFDAMALE